MHETPSSELAALVPRFWVATAAQRDTVPALGEGLRHVPDALAAHRMQKFARGHDTEFSEVASAAFTPGDVVHELPLHRSINVRCVDGVCCAPTAMQNDVREHDTPVRKFTVWLGFVDGRTIQRDPSNCSMSVWFELLMTK